jgi:predicted nucleic acid-binding protein
MRVMLDSAFVIDVLAGVPEAARRQRRLFEDGDEPYVNEIVVCEVRAGLRDVDVDEFETLLEPIEFIQPGPESAMLAGRWRRHAHERGQNLSLPDALIAAAAHESDAAILTRNVKDFALTPVRVETY